MVFISSRVMICFLLTISFGFHFALSETDASDASLVRSLKEQLKNPPANWATSDDPCGGSWTGIICYGPRIVELKLTDLGITGELTDAIGGLSELNVLKLSGNKLSGVIPDAIWNMKQLLVLELAMNSFTGSIPSKINALNNLVFLELGGNKLTGPLPDLNGMNFLEHVELSMNSFEKSEAPAWLWSLPSLKRLVMVNSSLVGSVPSKIFNLPIIELLDMRGNAFTGKLDLTSVSDNLQIIDFQNNDISSLQLGSKNIDIKLAGNPYCESPDANKDLCNPADQNGY